MRSDPTDALTELSFVVQDALTEIAAAEELPLSQLRLVLEVRGRRPPIDELARLLHVERRAAARLVARAHEHALVERSPALAGERDVRVRLTAKGRRLARRLEAATDARMAELLSGLATHERAQLSRLMRRILVGRG